MSELVIEKISIPKGWVKSYLDELIVFKIGGAWGESVSKKIPSNSVVVNVIRSTELKNWNVEKGKSADSRIVKKSILEQRQLKFGDIILEVSGGGSNFPVGRTVMIDNSVFNNFNHPIICSNFFRKISFSHFLNIKYIKYYLDYQYSLGLTRKFRNQSVNIQNLKVDEYLSTSILIPPLKEQTRIVEKIEELFSLIDFIKNSLKVHSTKLSHYEKSLLSFAFSGKLTSTWRSNLKKTSTGKKLLEDIFEQRRQNYTHICESSKKEGKKKPKRPDNLDYEEITIDRIPYAIPNDWIWCLTNYVCKQITDGEHINPKYIGSGNLLLSAKNIQKGYVTFKDVNYISDKDFEKATLRCKPEFNDVLVTSTGTVGRVAILKEQKSFAILRSVLLLKPDVILPEFLLYYLHTPIAFKLMSNASSASVQAHLYIGDMKLFPFPLPSLDEQRKIIQIIDPIISKIKIFNNECEKISIQLQMLKLSILKQAFEGKLVSQDPNDEPAEILLEKIKQEKQKIIHQTKRGKKNDK